MKDYKDYMDGFSAGAELQNKTLERLRPGADRERMWPRVVGTLAAVCMIAVMFVVGYGFWSGNDAPPLADASPAPYELGSVTIISGGTTYQPFEVMINSFDGQVYADMDVPSVSEVFEQIYTVISIEAGFEIVVTGTPHELTNNLYDPRLNWAYTMQKEFMEPPGRGEYLFLVQITWGSDDAYTGMGYYFKIRQEDGTSPDLIGGEGFKPYADLSADDIAGGMVGTYGEHFYYYLSRDEIRVLAAFLREVVVYETDESYREVYYQDYYGQGVGFTFPLMIGHWEGGLRVNDGVYIHILGETYRANPDSYRDFYLWGKDLMQRLAEDKPPDQNDDLNPAIRHIIEKVYAREIIEDDMYSVPSFGPYLKGLMNNYNNLTAAHTDYFFKRAINTICAVELLTDESGAYLTTETMGDYISLPQNARTMIETITGFSLYRNCTELFFSDPMLAAILERYGGSSYGDWARQWHMHWLEQDMHIALADYFSLVDELIWALKSYDPNVIPLNDDFRVSADLPVLPGAGTSETVEELIRIANGFATTSFTDLIWEDGTARLGIYSLLLSRFEPSLLGLRLSDEEAKPYQDQYGVEFFIETDVVDAFFYNYISKNAENILPAYRDETVADGKLVPYQALGITESDIPVFLRRMENYEEDGKIVLVFSILNRSPDNLYCNGWETHVGRVEGDEYILDAKVEDNSNLLLYTFIWEDGRYKIFSVTNRQ